MGIRQRMNGVKAMLAQWGFEMVGGNSTVYRNNTILPKEYMYTFCSTMIRPLGYDEGYGRLRCVATIDDEKGTILQEIIDESGSVLESTTSHVDDWTKGTD